MILQTYNGQLSAVPVSTDSRQLTQLIEQAIASSPTVVKDVWVTHVNPYRTVKQRNGLLLELWLSTTDPAEQSQSGNTVHEPDYVALVNASGMDRLALAANRSLASFSIGSIPGIKLQVILDPRNHYDVLAIRPSD